MPLPGHIFCRPGRCATQARAKADNMALLESNVMNKPNPRQKKTPKRVLRLPDLDYAKRAVLNALGSPESTRAYEFAIDDFIAWYCSEPRLAFSKTVVLRYRIELETRHLAPSTINLRWPPPARLRG